MTTGADSVTAWVAGTHDIATDAGAWAAVLSCGKHTKILSGNQLNTATTRMELTAVLEAVTSLKKPVVLSVFTLNANVVGWLNKRFKREDAHVEALCMSIDKAVLARGVKLGEAWS